MSSPFTLSPLLDTIHVATVRILPSILSKPSTFFLSVLSLTPVVPAFWLTPILALLQIVLSILTRSYAWNDRFWSLIPPIYALPYLLHSPLTDDRRTKGFDTRITLMSVLLFLWGARLTFNAARRGFYNPGFVDYRYHWIRQNYIPNNALFALIYAVFSCGYMTLLLSLVSSPLYFAWLARGTPLNLLDILATILLLLSLALQSIADNQQASFQRLKKLNLPHPDASNGFLKSGLFAYSRHPNFFAEMAVWWSFHIFSISTSRRVINWTLIGPILYTLLFQFTTPLTETISMQKYPAYVSYQKCVSRLIPLPTKTTKSD